MLLQRRSVYVPCSDSSDWLLQYSRCRGRMLLMRRFLYVGIKPLPCMFSWPWRSECPIAARLAGLWKVCLIRRSKQAKPASHWKPATTSQAPRMELTLRTSACSQRARLSFAAEDRFLSGDLKGPSFRRKAYLLILLLAIALSVFHLFWVFDFLIKQD